MTHNALFAQRKKAGMMLLTLLLLLSVVLAACGGTATSTPKRPAHPNSLTMLANEQDAYTQNFNPYSPGVISGTQGLINERCSMSTAWMALSSRGWLPATNWRAMRRVSRSICARAWPGRMGSLSPVMMWSLRSS